MKKLEVSPMVLVTKMTFNILASKDISPGFLSVFYGINALIDI